MNSVSTDLRNSDDKSFTILNREVFPENGERRLALMWWNEGVTYIVSGWPECCTVWWNVAHVLNHELIHGVIERIVEEDDLRGWVHWPFFAGIDEMFGYSYSHGHIQELLPTFFEEVRAFGHPHFRRYWKHDWDILF